MENFKYICVVFFITNCQPTCSQALPIEGDSHQHGHQLGLEAPDSCPVEYSVDTTIVPSKATEAKSFYENGDVVTYKCDATNSKWATEIVSFPHKLFVYPSANRTCLKDGTWSSALPICVHREENKRSERVEVLPVKVTRTSNKTMPPSWKKVGSLYKICLATIREVKVKQETRPSGNNTSIITITKMYAFPKHEHLSFTTIELPPGSDLIDFAVYAKKSDMITEMSDEARKFLTEHHDAYTSNLPSLNTEMTQCSIVELAVYAKQLVVGYTIQAVNDQQQHRTLPKGNEIDTIIRFHAVLRVGSGQGKQNMLNLTSDPPEHGPGADDRDNETPGSSSFQSLKNEEQSNVGISVARWCLFALGIVSIATISAVYVTWRRSQVSQTPWPRENSSRLLLHGNSELKCVSKNDPIFEPDKLRGK